MNIPNRRTDGRADGPMERQTGGQGAADTRISGYSYKRILVYYKGGWILVYSKHFPIMGTPAIIRLLYEVVIVYE
jgi:hypothetical protein